MRAKTGPHGDLGKAGKPTGAKTMSEEDLGRAGPPTDRPVLSDPADPDGLVCIMRDTVCRTHVQCAGCLDSLETFIRLPTTK